MSVRSLLRRWRRPAETWCYGCGQVGDAGLCWRCAAALDGCVADDAGKQTTGARHVRP